MSNKNKFGLSRHIPTDVAREVRKDCCFGCVICGKIPFTYDHFAPEFKDAKEHNSDGIALLCNNHHLEKTKGVLPSSKISKARKNPYNKNKNPIWKTTFGDDELRLNVGGNIVEGSEVGFTINDHIVLGIEAPNSKHEDWLITGSFCDHSGKETIKFNQNEIEIHSGSLDVTFVGTTLDVVGSNDKTVARVEFNIEEKEIVVKKLNMKLGNGHYLDATDEYYKIEGPNCNIDISNNIIGNASGSAIQIGERKVNKGFNTIDVNIPALGNWDDWTSED